MADKITQLQKELGTIIKGKKEVTDKIIMAVLARGHVLLEDVPGVGKTTTALALCRFMQAGCRAAGLPGRCCGV